jgi:hypothetical protein
MWPGAVKVILILTLNRGKADDIMLTQGLLEDVTRFVD